MRERSRSVWVQARRSTWAWHRDPREYAPAVRFHARTARVHLHDAVAVREAVRPSEGTVGISRDQRQEGYLLKDKKVSRCAQLLSEPCGQELVGAVERTQDDGILTQGADTCLTRASCRRVCPMPEVYAFK